MIFSTKKNINSDNQRRQFIVVGVQRGGTSAIASALQALGISLGNNFHEPIYEDLDMAAAFRAKNWKKLKKLIAAHELKHPQFAWKLPDSNTQLRKVSKLFSNPSFIYIYRDIFAIASRKQTVSDIELIEAMRTGLSAYNRIIKFSDKYDYPALHISYEKLLLEKKTQLIKLASFCDIQASEDLINQVSEAIEPSPQRYNQWVDISRQITTLSEAGYDGFIDNISTNRVSGWIVNKSSDSPISADLFINNQFITDLVCDEFRGDLIAAGKSITGNAGFNIELPNVTLNTGDHIKLQPKGSDISLWGHF